MKYIIFSYNRENYIQFFSYLCNFGRKFKLLFLNGIFIQELLLKTRIFKLLFEIGLGCTGLRVQARLITL